MVRYLGVMWGKNNPWFCDKEPDPIVEMLEKLRRESEEKKEASDDCSLSG